MCHRRKFIVVVDVDCNDGRIKAIDQLFGATNYYSSWFASFDDAIEQALIFEEDTIEFMSKFYGGVAYEIT